MMQDKLTSVNKNRIRRDVANLNKKRLINLMNKTEVIRV